MAYTKKGVCIDCGRVFTKHSDQQVRCPECQHEHKKKMAMEHYYATKDKRREIREAKKIEGAVYINGHPQICTHMASCYYGSVSNNGCSYLVETGKSRIVQGLYIEDGKCPCYKKKGRTRARRQEPLTFTFGVADRRGKDYSEV